MKNKLMKFLAFLVLLPSVVFAQAGADCWTGGLSLGNNKSLCARSANGQTDVKILKLGSDNLVYFNSTTPLIFQGPYFKINPDGDSSRFFTFDASSDVLHTLTFGDAGATAVQFLTISASTADADDDSTLVLAGGGAAGGTRGASITLPGEEVSGGGDISYDTGTSDTHIFKFAGTTDATLAAGSLTVVTDGWGINSSTADAADNKSISVSGGGSSSASRGGKLVVYGNEETGGTGSANLISGAVSGSKINLQGQHASTVVRVNPGASTTDYLDFGSSGNTNLTAKFGDAGVTAVQTFAITGSTADADDDGLLLLSGGGAAQADTRGSYLYLAGADLGGANAGDAQLAATDALYLSTGTSGAIRLTINNAGLGTWGAANDFAFALGGATLGLQEAVAGTACMGTLTCNGASDVVTSTSCATTGSRIFLTRTSLDADTTGDFYVKSISTGVSFTVACETSDTGTLNWIIFHESA